MFLRGVRPVPCGVGGVRPNVRGGVPGGVPALVPVRCSWGYGSGAGEHLALAGVQGGEVHLVGDRGAGGDPGC